MVFLNLILKKFKMQSIVRNFFKCYVLVLMLREFATADDSEETSLHLPPSFNEEAVKLAYKFKRCLGDDEEFYMNVINLADIASFLKDRFYSRNTEMLLVKMLKIAAISCEHDYEETDNNMLILTETVMRLTRSGFVKLDRFLDDLSTVFENDPLLGSFLSTRIGFLVRRIRFLRSFSQVQEVISELVINLTLFVRLLTDRDVKATTIKSYVFDVMETANHCYIYSNMIVKILVDLVQYSSDSSNSEIENVIVKLLHICKEMIKDGYDDIMSVILESLVKTGERFENCPDEFLETAEEFLTILDTILSIKCETLLIDFTNTMEKLICVR